MHRLLPLALVALIACHDDRPHVFQAAPPPPPRTATGLAAQPRVTTDADFGVRGADARIVGVSSLATGAPVQLGHLDTAVQVMTLVARGPGTWWPDGNARVELVFRGAQELRVVRPIERPAPTIIAHNFVVRTHAVDPAGLAPGEYVMQLRLVMRGKSALAESVPLHVSVP